MYYILEEWKRFTFPIENYYMDSTKWTIENSQNKNIDEILDITKYSIAKEFVIEDNFWRFVAKHKNGCTVEFQYSFKDEESGILKIK